MKKPIVIPIMFLALCFIVINTGRAESDKYLGIKLGTNISTFIGADAGGESSKSGLTCGFFSRSYKNNSLEFVFEVLYSSKGAEAMIEGRSYTFSFYYFELPLLFNIDLSPTGETHPNLFFGPAIAYNFLAKLSDGRSDVNLRDSGIDETIKMKDFDIGMVLGGNIDFPMEKYRFIIDLRYTMGVTSFSDMVINPGKTTDIRNSTISLTFGLSFPLGR